VDPTIESELRLDVSFPDVFEVDDETIVKRADFYQAVDPFPDVEPALLSTPDILDYAAATGMIHPFRVDAADYTVTLKPATYGVPLLGKYAYWRPGYAQSAAGDDSRVDGELAEGDELTLLPNTITFVTLEPRFRLPSYIAARYNLNIRDIHRGILVGTGPLVDPGFPGVLCVPIHNLTSNTYTLIGGEPLVWMEFTKLSKSDHWRDATDAEKPDRKGFYVEFPPRKKDVSLTEYLRRAHPGPIVSSIPAAVGMARVAAEDARADALAAREDADAGRRTIRNVSALAVVTVALALGAIIVPTWNLISDANARTDDVTRRLAELDARYKQDTAQQAERIAALEQALRKRAQRRNP
jgi:deoxycytidine triphosphate deaminase